jgi:hypothetical protein
MRLISAGSLVRAQSGPRKHNDMEILDMLVTLILSFFRPRVENRELNLPFKIVVLATFILAAVLLVLYFFQIL